MGGRRTTKQKRKQKLLLQARYQTRGLCRIGREVLQSTFRDLQKARTEQAILKSKLASCAGACISGVCSGSPGAAPKVALFTDLKKTLAKRKSNSGPYYTNYVDPESTYIAPQEKPTKAPATPKASEKVKTQFCPPSDIATRQIEKLEDKNASLVVKIEELEKVQTALNALKKEINNCSLERKGLETTVETLKNSLIEKQKIIDTCSAPELKVKIPEVRKDLAGVDRVNIEKEALQKRIDDLTALLDGKPDLLLLDKYRKFVTGLQKTELDVILAADINGKSYSELKVLLKSKNKEMKKVLGDINKLGEVAQEKEFDKLEKSDLSKTLERINATMKVMSEYQEEKQKELETPEERKKMMEARATMLALLKEISKGSTSVDDNGIDVNAIVVDIVEERFEELKPFFGPYVIDSNKAVIARDMVKLLYSYKQLSSQSSDRFFRSTERDPISRQTLVQNFDLYYSRAMYTFLPKIKEIAKSEDRAWLLSHIEWLKKKRDTVEENKTRLNRPDRSKHHGFEPPPKAGRPKAGRPTAGRPKAGPPMDIAAALAAQKKKMEQKKKPPMDNLAAALAAAALARKK